MTCIDWPATLRPASFRGVPFFVETDEMEVGRRLVVHEFPNRDRPYVEDLGEMAITYSVTAYLASDGVLAEKNALLAACRQRGPATLVLPTEGSQLVRCRAARRTHEKDRMGFIAFMLDFVEAGAGLFASPVALLERLVGVAATAAVPIIAAAFLSRFNTIRQDDWVVRSAADVVTGWVATADSVVASTAMKPSALKTIGRALTRAARNAERLAVDGRDVVEVHSDRIGLSSVQAAKGALVTAASDLLIEVREGAIDERAAYAAMRTLAGIEDTTVPEPYGISGRRDRDNLAALGSMFRSLALIEMAVAGAEAAWPDRTAAVNVRAEIAEMFERELHAAHERADLFAALDTVSGKAAVAISAKLADLDPVVVVESNAVMPARVWAHRLYADASRASELAARNRVAHPSFMPEAFEAEAPLGELEAAHRRTTLGG